MYEKLFQLEILTPGKVVFKDEASSLSAPGVAGNFQVLFNHAPFLSALDVGEIKVKDKSGTDVSYATSGGFVEVKENHVVVLADAVERTDEIDVERAKAAKERAQQRLKSMQMDVDLERARAALSRANNRLRLIEKG